MPNKTVVSLRDNGCALPTQRKFKDSGAMIAPATIARTGVMEYSAGQLGEQFADLPATQVIKVMTTAEELFSAETLESCHSAPITILHPDDDVTVDNAQELQHGHLVGAPFAEGEELQAHIVLSDRDALDLVESGTDQLSLGHNAVVIRVADADVERLGYHAYKTNIRVNHVAIVPAGRAGSARIADAKEELPEGASAPQERETANNIEQKLKDAAESLSVVTAKLHDAQEKLVAKETAFRELEASVQTRVRDALAFLAQASLFTEKDLVGMPIAEAKRIVLQDQLGRSFDDKDDVYINTRYEIFLEDAADEHDSPITQALKDNLSFDPTPAATPSGAEAARERMIARNQTK